MKHLEFLSPTADADRSGIYVGTLKRAIKEKSVLNIALSGPYGSGKSSILEAFKKNADENKIVEVSLANFEHVGSDVAEGGQDTPDGNETLQLKIEKSILQQLFFSVDKSTLPYSRLKRIHEPGRFFLLMYAALVLLWAFLGFLLINPEIYETYFAIDNRTENLTIFFLLLSGALLYLAFAYLSKVKLSKVVIQNNEFDLSGEEKETSLINKHIDEIIYFFKKTECEVLIIEDLDRFNSKLVFEKLRELNTIINHAGTIKQKVTFIYAVKDDFFIDENRTKFFDLIVPVIPFINATGNARHKFIEKLERAGLGNAISEDLLKYLSYCVHDYRLLLNIFNEFLVYLCELNLYGSRKEGASSSGEASRNIEKLFSMIVYKNLFPEDFSKLHKGEGVLYEIFTVHKQVLLVLLTKDLEKRIKDHEDEITLLRKEHLESLAELRLVYLNSIMPAQYHVGAIVFGNQAKPLKEVAENEDLFNGVLQQKEKIQIVSMSRPHQSIARQINVIQDDKGLERIKRFGQEKEKTIRNLQKEMEKLRRKRDDIRLLDLSELLGLPKAEEVFSDMLQSNRSSTQESENPDSMLAQETRYGALKFMVREGYIDESYRAYISYFHEGGGLSRFDYEYIRDVLDHKEPEYGRAVTNPREVIGELGTRAFRSRYFLNYEIVHELFCSGDDTGYRNLKASVARLLSEDNETARSFLPSFVGRYASKPCVASLVGMIAEEDSGFWKKVRSWEVDTGTLLAFLLKAAPEKSLLGQGDALKDSVFRCKQLPQLLERYGLDREALQNVLLKWKGEFKSLEVPPEDGAGLELLRFVYEHDLYALNADMIRMLVRSLGSFENGYMPDEKRAVDYGVIRRSGLEYLVERIDENIDIYVKEVYLNHILTDKNLHSRDTILLLLNHENLSNDLIAAIASEMDIVVENLADIDRCEAKKAVVHHAKFTPLWDNILDYFPACTSSMDSALLHCLCNDEFIEDLQEDEVPRSGESLGRFAALSEVMMFDNDFDRNCLLHFRNIIGPLDSIEMDISGVALERIRFLIDKRMLDATPEIYEKLREYDAESSLSAHLYLLEKFFPATLELLQKITVDPDDIRRLLQSPRLVLSMKIELLCRLPEKLDLRAIAAEAADVALVAMNALEEFLLPVDILKVILESELELNKKIFLLAHQLPKVTNAEKVSLLLEAVGGSYLDLLSELEEGRTVKLPFSHENKTILEVLQRFKIVGKVRLSAEEDEFIVYKKNH